MKPVIVAVIVNLVIATRGESVPSHYFSYYLLVKMAVTVFVRTPHKIIFKEIASATENL